MASTSSTYLASASQALGSSLATADGKHDKEVNAFVDKIKKGAKEVTDLKALDGLLSSRTFLVGNSLTLADIALLSTHYDKVSKLSPAEQYSHLNVTRYFSHISHLAARLPHDASAQYAVFDPNFEEQPAIERKDAAAERQKQKESKQAATATAGDDKAESVAATGAASAGVKKEKKAKAASGGGSEGKKNKNEPAAAFVPLPSHVDLRVGKIVDIKRHPDADSLYLEQVDFGEPDGPRTILSGLVRHVPIEKMQGRYVVGVCNLKPATMRGIKSYGMLLCVTHKDGQDKGVEPVLPPEGSALGDRVFVEGYEGMEPEAVLNPKKKIFETIQPSYRTTDAFECAWLGAGPNDGEQADKTARRIRTEKGVCTAPGFAQGTLS